MTKKLIIISIIAKQFLGQEIIKELSKAEMATG